MTFKSNHILYMQCVMSTVHVPLMVLLFVLFKGGLTELSVCPNGNESLRSNWKRESDECTGRPSQQSCSERIGVFHCTRLWCTMSLFRRRRRVPAFTTIERGEKESWPFMLFAVIVTV